MTTWMSDEKMARGNSPYTTHLNKKANHSPVYELINRLNVTRPKPNLHAPKLPPYILCSTSDANKNMTCIQKRNFLVLKSTRSMKHTLAPASLAYWSNSTEFIYWGKKKIISRGMSRRYCLYIPEVLNSFWHIEREKNKQTKQLVTSAITRIWVLCWQATV